MVKEEHRRKTKVKNRKNDKRKLTQMIKISMIMIIVILGCFIVQIIYQEFFGQVDVVLDAGHGGSDPGAIYEDAIEKEITLEIAELTKELLEESGYKVAMTRDDDSFVKLDGRARLANKRKAKAFVSIHCNASENGAGNGVETFYNEQKEVDDRVLAEMVQKAVIEQTNANDRGIKVEDYTVIVRTNMPAVLIEIGFLTNDIEKELLMDEIYQKKIAKGISEGVMRYLPSLD